MKCTRNNERMSKKTGKKNSKYRFYKREPGGKGAFLEWMKKRGGVMREADRNTGKI